MFFLLIYQSHLPMFLYFIHSSSMHSMHSCTYAGDRDNDDEQREQDREGPTIARGDRVRTPYGSGIFIRQQRGGEGDKISEVVTPPFLTCHVLTCLLFLSSVISSHILSCLVVSVLVVTCLLAFLSTHLRAFPFASTHSLTYQRLPFP